MRRLTVLQLSLAFINLVLFVIEPNPFSVAAVGFLVAGACMSATLAE